MGNILRFSNSQEKGQVKDRKHLKTNTLVSLSLLFFFFFPSVKNIQKHSKSKSSDQVLVILLCPYEKVKCSHRTLHTTLSHEEPSGIAPRPVKNDHVSSHSMEPDPFKQNKFNWQLVFLAYSRPCIYQRKAFQDNSLLQDYFCESREHSIHWATVFLPSYLFFWKRESR